MANFIIRNENLMEERVFGDYSFPLEIFYNILSVFEHGFVDPHWHSELELTIVQNGEMEYQVNDKIYELKAGSGVFVNSKSLHTARPYPDRDCVFYSIVFNPILISSHENSKLNHYIDELTDSNDFPSFLICPEVDWQNSLLEILEKISQIYQKHEIGYDLTIKGKLCEFWSIFYNGTFPFLQNRKLFEAKNIQQMKRMLAFIQDNYTEKLTLEDIAESANVSKSECCRLFKKVMKQSPVGYLIDYRIQKSIPLILSKKFTITQISEKVGFGNSCYFSEMFRRVIHCSPSDYQKKH